MARQEKEAEETSEGMDDCSGLNDLMVQEWRELTRAPREEFEKMKEGVMRDFVAHDEESIFSLVELSESAKETLALNEAMRIPSGEAFSEDWLIKMKEFVLAHSNLVTSGFREVLDEKIMMMELTFESVGSVIFKKWDKVLKRLMDILSNRVAFVRNGYDNKLEQSRTFGEANLERVLTRVQVEHEQETHRREEQHQREVRLLKEEYESRISVLQTELKAEVEKTKALANTLNSSKQKVAFLEARCKSLELENLRLQSELTAQLGKSNGDSESAQKFISALQFQLRQSLDRVNSLEETVSEREAAIDELQATLEHKHKIVEDTKHKLESTEQILQVFREDLQRTRQDYAELQEFRKKLEEKIDILVTQLTRKDESLNNLQMEKEQLELRNKWLAESIETQHEAIQNEKRLNAEKAASFEKALTGLQEQLASKNKKIQHLQQDMLEYARLQKRILELEDLHAKQVEENETNRRNQQDEAYHIEKTLPPSLKWNNQTGLWEHDINSIQHSPKTEISRGGLSLAKFMSKLAQGRHEGKATVVSLGAIEANKSKESIHETGWRGGKVSEKKRSNSPIDVERSQAKEDFVLKTEEIKAKLEEDLRRCFERDILANLRLEFLNTMKSDLENRIRREMTIQFQFKLQAHLREEQQHLLDSGDINKALETQDRLFHDLHDKFHRRELEVAQLHDALDALHEDCATLSQSLKEKDKLISQLTEVVRAGRVRNRSVRAPVLPLGLVEIETVSPDANLSLHPVHGHDRIEPGLSKRHVKGIGKAGIKEILRRRRALPSSRPQSASASSSSSSSSSRSPSIASGSRTRQSRTPTAAEAP